MWERGVGLVLGLGLLAACETPFDVSTDVGNTSSEHRTDHDTNRSDASPAPAGDSTENAGTLKGSNHAPVIHSLVRNPGSGGARTGEKITFNVVATDADSDTLTYTWSSTQGLFSSTSGAVTYWFPPDLKDTSDTGTATITVLVSDGKTVEKASVTIQIDTGLAQSPTPTVTATPTPTPTAVPWSTTFPEHDDCCFSSNTTFNGKVYDDTNAPLNNVTVTAKSLNSSVLYDEVSTTTADGNYAFNNAPAGIQIEITASRSGYATRRRVEVLKSNKQGDPDANRYDFGADGGADTFGVEYNALSDKPEVIAVTPGRNAAGIAPNTRFVLTFSEPMDRNAATKNFEIRTYTTEALTVDNGTTFEGSYMISRHDGSRIWDKAAFNASWNSEDTELTMTFKEGRMLPSDQDSDKTPDYQVSFYSQDHFLKDKAGVVRSSAFFKLTDGPFEESYKFSINTDEDKPKVDSITAYSAENASGAAGDTIKVRFSERMVHYTLSATIIGGMDGVLTSAPDAAINYAVNINGEGEMTWDNYGTALFDSGDPTHKTVVLSPTSPTDEVFLSGDDIEVRVATTVLDPAGNRIDINNHRASAIAY